MRSGRSGSSGPCSGSSGRRSGSSGPCPGSSGWRAAIPDAERQFRTVFQQFRMLERQFRLAFYQFRRVFGWSVQCRNTSHVQTAGTHPAAGTHHFLSDCRNENIS
jgi:hypothetical protein